MIRLASIHIYPVKGTRGHGVAEAALHPWGLDGDRRWLAVDESGRFLTQRDHAVLALVVAHAAPDGGLVLSAPGHKTLAVATPDPGAPSRDVAIWRDTVPAVDAGDDAACWLTAVLNRPARLVHQADPTTRAVRPAYARPGDCVSFADGFPLLLASTASLADLNRRLGSPIAMTRFRPNLVFEGTMTWEEDCWLRIGIGTAVLRVAKPCDRCVVTTIDQDSAQRPDPVEPIRTLGTFRRDRRGGVMFGQNAVPERCGVLRVGDAVEVLEIGPANVMFEERRAGSASF